MLESVRVRLTLWYTGVLALVLVVIALATYFILWRGTAQRTDTSLAELADAFLTTLHDELKDQNGPDALKLAAQEAIVEHRYRDVVFAVLAPSGSLVITSQDPSPVNPSPDRSAQMLFSSNSFLEFVAASSHSDRLYRNLPGRGVSYRAYARQFAAKGETCTLVVLQSLRAQKELLAEIARTFAIVIPMAILLASGGGYFLARKSLAPVVSMSRQAGRIGAANLHERLLVLNENDELGHLARAFNDLLDRLAQSFERQRRFMADASHELRTPAAILHGEAEVALAQDARSPEEYRESLAILREEAQRLSKIVEDLFTLARADTGQLPLRPREFYLDEMVSECVRSARSLALGNGIELTCNAAEEMPICGDEELLRRMTMNLLDNAIKYTPRGGHVTVECLRQNGKYVLNVRDSGPGIPAGAQSHVFERFFRVDKVRSHAEKDGGGAGLGLSIAQWIAEAHHGRLELVRSDSTGSIFSAVLPASQPGSVAGATLAR